MTERFMYVLLSYKIFEGITIEMVSEEDYNVIKQKFDSLIPNLKGGHGLVILK